MLDKDFNIKVNKQNKFLMTIGAVDHYGNSFNLYHQSLTKDDVNLFILTVRVSKSPFERSGTLIINSPEDRLRICKKLLTYNLPHVKDIMKDYIKFCNERITELMERKSLFDIDSNVALWNEESINDFVRIKNEWTRTLNAYKPKNKFIKDKITELDISIAKDFSITNLINFNSQKFACCIFHDEDSPSMKYYPNTNSVHCFGCNKSADSISVAQQIYGEDFISAVKRLSGK